MEDLQQQKKDLESKVQPIISKLYKDAGGAPPEHDHTEDKDEL